MLLLSRCRLGHRRDRRPRGAGTRYMDRGPWRPGRRGNGCLVNMLCKGSPGRGSRKNLGHGHGERSWNMSGGLDRHLT